MVRPIIVGLDPGITTGIAILDVDGNLLSLTSRRDIRRNEVIRFITRFGRPLIIASDVNPAPRSVKRTASLMGSKIYYPEVSLPVLEKQELAKEFVEKIRNGHEVDALAACLKSWKNHRSLFSKVKIRLQELGHPEIFQNVLLKLLKEGGDNIDDAVTKTLEAANK